MELSVADRTLRFVPVDLFFSERNITNTFARMNSQSVAGMVAKTKYARLARETAERYAHRLEEGIGHFLLSLKRDGDPFYQRFLNRYGDLTYCRFAIKSHLTSRGIYIYMREKEIVYIGRSLDPFAKRVNQGYGTIHPRNCYLDGQATNCHLNALIAENTAIVSFYVTPVNEAAEIVALERLLILRERPPWNIALARGSIDGV
jgi:hypothetical protein